MVHRPKFSHRIRKNNRRWKLKNCWAISKVETYILGLYHRIEHYNRFKYVTPWSRPNNRGMRGQQWWRTTNQKIPFNSSSLWDFDWKYSKKFCYFWLSSSFSSNHCGKWTKQCTIGGHILQFELRSSGRASICDTQLV